MGYDYKKHDLIARANAILADICGDEKIDVEDTINFSKSYTEVEQPSLTLIAKGVTNEAFNASNGLAPQANFYIRLSIRYYKHSDYNYGYEGNIGVWLTRQNKSEIFKLTQTFKSSDILTVTSEIEACASKHSNTFNFHFLHN